MASSTDDSMCSLLLAILKQENNSSSKDKVVDLPTIITTANDLQIFSVKKQGNIVNWIGYINNLLNAAKTRLEGVSLLGTLVSQCPAGIFQHHCISWVRLLTQILQSHDSSAIITSAVSVLKSLLEHAAQISEVSRELSQSNLAIIVSAALEMKQHDSALLVLTACIRYFPGPCGLFRTRMENFFIQHMGSYNKEIALAASRCLTLLPQVGGGGQAGIKHTEAWSHYIHRVLDSAMLVIDNLYVGSQQDNLDGPAPNPILVQPAPIREPTRTYTLVGQFTILCTCLENMLRSEFPELVKIPVDLIMSLCYKVLDLNGKHLSKKSAISWTLLAGCLPSVHCDAFSVLDALISSCCRNMVPHGHKINMFFLQALGWTMSSQSDDVNRRPYSRLRVSVYSTLETWLESVGGCSGIDAVAEKLVEHIINDAQPQTPIIKLKIAADKPMMSLINKLSSGKTKPQSRVPFTDGTTPSASGQQLTNSLANNHVCKAALKVLRCLILNFGPEVKPEVYKGIHEFLIPLVLHVQQNPPGPYSIGECRHALYHALLMCVTAPHPGWPAPLQVATALFNRGRQDPSRMVSSFCAEASLHCQNIIHPRVHTLQASTSVAELYQKQLVNNDFQSRSDDFMMTCDAPGNPISNSKTDEQDSFLLTTSVHKPTVDNVKPGWSMGQIRSEDTVNGDASSSTNTDDEEKDYQFGRGVDFQKKDETKSLSECVQDVTTKKDVCFESEAVKILVSEADCCHDSLTLIENSMSSPTRSKRQLEQCIVSRNNDGDILGEKYQDVDERSKKRKTGELRDNEVKDLFGEVSDDTVVMLESFVDSLPDDN